MTQPRGDAAVIGLLPWGNVIEDFLDPLGLSLDQFCGQFTGSWMFSYADALARAGVKTVLIFVSRQVNRPTRRTHTPSGVTMIFLPPSPAYRWLLPRMRNPYGRSRTDVFSRLAGWRSLLTPLYAFLSPLALYAATPPTALARVLRAEQCDAVLCQEYEYPRFDVCVLVGWWLRLPVFASFQGGDYQRSPLERVIRPIALRRCAGVVIGSSSEVERVRRIYALPTPRIGAIPNPVDTSFWVRGDPVAARAQLGIPPSAQVVVWHGRVDIRKKGLDVLLQAWQQLYDRSEHDPARPLMLVLVGSGPDDELLRQSIDDLGPRAIVWVRRFLNDRELIKGYLTAADVYVFPSRHEGFPMAPIEAMSCGLPIVAAAASGIRDLLGDGDAYGGVSVPADDSEALAAALGRQLSNPEYRRELGRRARACVLAVVGADEVGARLRHFLSRPRSAGVPLRNADAPSTAHRS